MVVLAILSLAISLAFVWPVGIPWALALLGVSYVSELYANGQTAGNWTAVYAAGLLLAGELAYWSLSLRIPARRQPTLMTRQAAFLVLLIAGSLALATLLQLIALVPINGSPVLVLISVLTAATALGLITSLAWRGHRASG